MKPVSTSTRRPAVGFRSGTIPPAHAPRLGAEETEGEKHGEAAPAESAPAPAQSAPAPAQSAPAPAQAAVAQPVPAPPAVARPAPVQAVPSGKMEPEIVLSDERGAGEAPALTTVGEGVAGLKKTPFKKAGPSLPEATPEEPQKAKRSWMFWRRPSKRSMELAEVRRGCEKIEQVVGAIRDQMATAEKDRVVLNKTLSPLPLAVDGLRRVGENQEQTNVVLQKVGASLDRAEDKDKVFFQNMDRMGETMSNMDMAVVGMGRTFSSIERTSKQSVDTMQRLSERLAESDRFMKELFQRLREAEREYGDHMRTNARRSAVVTITMCALMTLGIAVLAHTLGGASHNVTVLRPHVPPAAVPLEPVVEPSEVPGPEDWQAEPTGLGAGVARGDVADDPTLDDFSAIPAPVEMPEQFEDLLIPVSTRPAE